MFHIRLTHEYMETRVAVHAKQESHRRPENITQHIAALAAFCSRSASLETQHNYFKRRRLFLQQPLRIPHAAADHANVSSVNKITPVSQSSPVHVNAGR